MNTIARLSWYLRHPAALLRRDRWMDSVGFCIEDATALVPDCIDIAWDGPRSGATVAIGAWTCQISGGALHLRDLADLLNGRADLCDAVAAIIARGGDPTAAELGMPPGWCPVHVDAWNRRCPGCDAHGPETPDTPHEPTRTDTA